ncbi:MAG: hypothetical protein ACE5JS_09555 [Nitrospinota bacterium]
MNIWKWGLALGILGLTACAETAVRKEEAWNHIPGVASDADSAMGRLAEVLWREQENFRPGRFRRFLPPVRRLAVGAVLNFDTHHRTLLSQRLETLLARRLERVSGGSVVSRREMVRWEDEFALRRAKNHVSAPLLRRDASIRAAEFWAVDAVVLGTYRIVQDSVVVNAEFLRLTPAFGRPTLSVARAQVSLSWSALSLSEVIAQIPVRARDILPKPPDDWVWNPISVWYEVIKKEGRHLKGVDGTVLSPGDTFLVSFMAARPLYVMVLRMDSGGEIRRLFPEKSADLSERAEVDRRYSIPDRLTESSQWAAAYVLFSDEPFRYRRDVLPGFRSHLAQVSAGVFRGIGRAGIVLPAGIFQKQLWFTQLRDKPRSDWINSGSGTKSARLRDAGR